MIARPDGDIGSCGGAAVVIPVHDRARTVLDTLTSVARQSLPPTEVIVVDDGSTDGLHDVLARWQREAAPAFPLRLLRQVHGGASAAKNRGMSETTAAFVALLDSDDEWPPDFLQRCVPALAARPDAVAVSCDTLTVDALSGERESLDLSPIAHGGTRWLFARRTGIGSTTLFRAAALRHVGGHDESLPTGHDAALYLRVSLLGAWLHAPGSPVIIGRHRALVHGERDHIRNSLVNHEHRWAAIREDFIERGGGRDALPELLRREQMSHRWYRAGRDWYRIGRMRAARQCFRRSLRYRVRGQTLLKLALASVRRGS